MAELNPTKLFQHGTLALLVPGLFDGTMTVSELLKHGNAGIGTPTGLDGEMVILAGTPYLVRADGSVTVVDGDVKVPFANVHYDQPSESFDISGMDFKQFGDFILKERPLENVFFAVKMTGTFKAVKTRAVEKQTKPYPGLGAVANAQKIFEATNTTGTIIGYFSPELFAGMAAPGYHLHYLDDAHTVGGHLLNFTIDQATVSLQPFTSVENSFPVDNKEFMNTHFDLKTMEDEIRGAESD